MSYADSRRQDLQFQVGDEALLSTHNLRSKAPEARKWLHRLGCLQLLRELVM